MPLLVANPFELGYWLFGKGKSRDITTLTPKEYFEKLYAEEVYNNSNQYQPIDWGLIEAEEESFNGPTLFSETSSDIAIISLFSC